VGGTGGAPTCSGDTGTPAFADSYGQTGLEESISEVVVDASGNVYISGSYEATTALNLGCGALTIDGGYDGFLAKYNAAGVCQWSITIGATNTTGYEEVNGLAVDSQGNVLVGGWFDENIDFDDDGTPDATSGGNLEYYGFVAKYDGTNGTNIWGQAYGAANEGVIVFDVAVDSSNAPIVTGGFAGTVNFGGTGPLSATDEDAFALKLLPNNGNTVWDVQLGGADDQRGIALAVDGSGDVIAAGLEYDSQTAAMDDVGVAKLAGSTGVTTWSQVFSPDDGNGASVADVDVLSSGDVVVVGAFDTSLTFTSTLTTTGDLAGYVARLSAGAGAEVWAHAYGSAGSGLEAAVNGLAIDDCDNIILTGAFDVSIDFGGGALTTTTTGDFDMFLAKLTDGATEVWAFDFGDTDFQRGSTVGVNAQDNIVAAGIYTGTANFGGGHTVTTSDTNVFDVFLAGFSK